MDLELRDLLFRGFQDNSAHHPICVVSCLLSALMGANIGNGRISAFAGCGHSFVVSFGSFVQILLQKSQIARR